MNLHLAGKKSKEHKSSFQVGNLAVGSEMILIAGPCSVESEEQICRIAREVKDAGANILRGGAYKPRTSPYTFQGLGREGLAMLQTAGKQCGLPVVSEVLDPRDVLLVAEHVDILQVGARNMQNHALLKEVGSSSRPVLLKRGMNASIEEWLYSAEYIMCAGNEKVILCERGIRTHESYTRNTLDLSAVAAARNLSHLPVIADPSHGTGLVPLIGPMCLAAIMAGADGCMVEVHDRPAEALSDEEQALLPRQFAKIAGDMRLLWAFKTKSAV